MRETIHNPIDPEILQACAADSLPQLLTGRWKRQLNDILNAPEMQQQERRRILAAEFGDGLDLDACVGVHGTSLEAVRYLLAHGHLPGTTTPMGISRGMKDLSFFPVRRHFEDKEGFEDIQSDEKILKGAREYASLIAAKHYILDMLGLDIGNEENMSVASVLADLETHPEEMRKTREFLKTRGLRLENLEPLRTRAQERQGVIFGLHPDILEQFPILPGDPDECDRRIHCPDGFGIQLIKGMEPIGEDEFEYLEHIQDQETPEAE